MQSRKCWRKFRFINTLRKIARIKDYLTSDIQTLVHAFITSKLDNCNSLLYGLPKFLIDRQQNVQNCAARLVTGGEKYDYITPIMKQLLWLPINKRIIYKVALITFLFTFNKLLVYFVWVFYEVQRVGQP